MGATWVGCLCQTRGFAGWQPSAPSKDGGPALSPNGAIPFPPNNRLQAGAQKPTGPTRVWPGSGESQAHPGDRPGQERVLQGQTHCGPFGLIGGNHTCSLPRGLAPLTVASPWAM